MRFRDRLAHEPWAPATFNKKIRAIKTFVGWAIDNDFCPKLHHDDLRRIKYKRQEVELRGYYSPTVLQGILDAAKRHDAETFGQTRAEKTAGRKAETPCHTQITPFVVLVMLSGARLSEAVQLTWADFDPDALNENGDEVGEIVVPASIAKTKRARVIGLEVSPLLRQMLIARRLQTGGQGTLGGVSRSGATRSLLRMRRTYGAPEFTWQGLRRSTSTYLTSSPQIYGSASIHLAAAQLGHSVNVAQSHYTGSARGIARNAHTLEDAMQIKIQIGAVESARGLHTA
jgi:integrase